MIDLSNMKGGIARDPKAEVVYVDEAELVLRMFECWTDKQRPADLADVPAREQLDAICEIDPRLEATVDCCAALTKVAFNFFMEVTNSQLGKPGMVKVDTEGTRQ